LRLFQYLCLFTFHPHLVPKQNFTFFISQSNMVRRNAAADAASTTHDITPAASGGSDSLDSGSNTRKSSRKAQKRRERDAAMRGCVVVLIGLVLVVVSLVAIVTRSNNPKTQRYAPSKLRTSRSLIKSETVQEGDGGTDDDETPNAGQAVEFLPPNSIYNVAMESIQGELVDFSKYRGFVSLIVNVACL
jgi:Glutathione peroxidase